MGMDGGEPRLEGLRRASVSPDAVQLDAARFGFDRAFPQRSARRTFFVTQILAFALLAGAIAWAFEAAPSLTFGALHIGALVLFALAILWRLLAAANLSPLLSPLAADARLPTYTLLCPLYREANVVPDLVAALAAIDYPGLMPQSGVAYDTP
ncbi:MAG: hypothetical protein AB7O98_18000 [Hyphomonadaceae bacterium]